MGALSLCGYEVYGVSRWLREINEPDPSEIDTKKVSRLFTENGISARAERLLYVNLDYNGTIFLGEIDLKGFSQKPVATNDSRLKATEVEPSELNRRLSGRYSLLRVVTLPDGRKVFGFIASTTQGELSQAESGFRERTDQLSQALVDEQR
ncbi:hypothetical protein EON79_05810 [bacterium]|nr:MAG: hypothetical protein EON79_05810 [bacterium]